MVEQAASLGIAGSVRNRADGSVEAVVQGPTEMVEAIVAKCEVGPSAARVKKVVAQDVDAPVMDGFEQRPTL